MKRIRRFGLFSWTLLSSAWNQWRITGEVSWRAAPNILRALWPGPSVNRGPGSMWWRRVRGCQHCELYDRRRRACGRLGETYQRGGIKLPLGCGCSLLVKPNDPDAECFLWAETGGEAGFDWAKTVAKTKD